MKPIAFRIFNFKSIQDSGCCTLSADGITILAGQNESGKTAILSALRDFDLLEGSLPQTADYWPDHCDVEVRPQVAVLFEVTPDEVRKAVEEEGKSVPESFLNLLELKGRIWIYRDLPTCKYLFEKSVGDCWGQTQTKAPSSAAEHKSEAGATEASRPIVALKELGRILRMWWPQFVYFDSFSNTLPRSVPFSQLKSGSQSVAESSTGAAEFSTPKPVEDFVALSGIDLERLEVLAKDDKRLDNYLRSKSAKITGDFLSYWKQTVDGEQTVELHVSGRRDDEGELKLNFFVVDSAQHYPDQRSKGFLWFLSFYLRLTASQVREPDRDHLLLIDEPGSYLHARAQRDVLNLFEERLIKRDRIIYSTHSPFLIPADKLHRLRLVAKLPRGTKIYDRLTHPDLAGENFRDALSPILTAIGLDIREALAFVREKNVIVEGISDYLYLTGWATLLKNEILKHVNIFPAIGAMSTCTLASLFIGWGLPMIVLLDRDDQGTAARNKLEGLLGLAPSLIVQPKSAMGIEDLFSFEDFKKLVKAFNPDLTVQQGDSPTRFIKRTGIDKTLLARRFSELVSAKEMELTRKTQDAVESLLAELCSAAGLQPRGRSKATAAAKS